MGMFFRYQDKPTADGPRRLIRDPDLRTRSGHDVSASTTRSYGSLEAKQLSHTSPETLGLVDGNLIMMRSGFRNDAMDPQRDTRQSENVTVSGRC